PETVVRKPASSQIRPKSTQTSDRLLRFVAERPYVDLADVACGRPVGTATNSPRVAAGHDSREARSRRGTKNRALLERRNPRVGRPAHCCPMGPSKCHC